jgi:hypothetical protein
MKLSTLVAASALVLATTLGAQPQSASAQDAFIAPELAAKHAGKSGTVCGTVGKARFAQNSEGEPTFLYMGGSFPRHTFTARIPGAVRAQFKPSPESLEGKDVCVIGDIARDAGRAEIVVSSPANLKLAVIR